MFSKFLWHLLSVQSAEVAAAIAPAVGDAAAATVYCRGASDISCYLGQYEAALQHMVALQYRVFFLVINARNKKI